MLDHLLNKEMTPVSLCIAIDNTICIAVLHSLVPSLKSGSVPRQTSEIPQVLLVLFLETTVKLKTTVYYHIMKIHIYIIQPSLLFKWLSGL